MWRVHITSSVRLRYWILDTTPNSKIDVAWKSTGNQCVSNEDVINSQENLRKDFCYALMDLTTKYPVYFITQMKMKLI